MTKFWFFNSLNSKIPSRCIGQFRSNWLNSQQLLNSKILWGSCGIFFVVLTCFFPGCFFENLRAPDKSSSFIKMYERRRIRAKGKTLPFRYIRLLVLSVYRPYEYKIVTWIIWRVCARSRRNIPDKIWNRANENILSRCFDVNTRRIFFSKKRIWLIFKGVE